MKFVKISLIVLCFGFLLFSSCNEKGMSSISGTPGWLKENPPGDEIWGIGVAKTESDGESILLAEDRARVEIARMLLTSVNMSGDFTVQQSNVYINGSRVVYRDKDKNGSWWVLISMPKVNHDHRHIIGQPLSESYLNSIRANAKELSNIEKHENIVRNVDFSSIEWVFRPEQHLPKSKLYGLGAAKLDNDGASIYLAKERARQSLTRSFHSDVKSILYDFNENDTEVYQEENFSVTSMYDTLAVKEEVLFMAKTKDGTWFVLLAAPSPFFSSGITFDEHTLDADSLRRIEEAFKLLDSHFESTQR